MLFSRVFVYTEPRSANQNPRRSASLAPAASLPLHFRHRDEKPRVASPLVPAGCKRPLPQPLFFHILTNAPGVWGSTLPFLKSYLNSTMILSPLPPQKAFSKSLVFNSLRALPSSVPCNPFVCHSYQNCRVYTNNSHCGTQKERS